MKTIDEYDIRQAFDVLDVEKDGTIGVHDLQTIHLALGFQPHRTSLQDLRETLEKEVPQGESTSRLSIETVLSVLSKRRRDSRRDTFRACFDVIDADGKGYIDAADLKRLHAVQDKTICDVRASTMIRCAALPAAVSDRKNQERVVDFESFYQFLSPPDP